MCGTKETRERKKSGRSDRVRGVRMRPCCERVRGACVDAGAQVRCRRAARKGGATTWLLAQRARDSPLQKVHCIYKSFIMNYTMVYLKWEACLVRGYMGYRDYNACRAERETGTTTGWDTRNRTLLSCRCFRVRTHHHRLSFFPCTSESSALRTHASTNW